MKTEETISTVCADLGISKADLAKRMGMLPSSLYRKLSRESMTFEEFQKCLDVLGVTVEFELRYPDGNVKNSQENQEMLLGRIDLLEAQLEVARKLEDFNRNALRDLRTELNNAVGYAQLARKQDAKASGYLDKLQLALANMEEAIAYSLGEGKEEPDTGDPGSIEMLKGRRVLLADDNEMNREIAREILLSYGLIVEEVVDGSEALQALKEKEPGFYHLVRIRKFPNRIRANIPIIALTANVFPEDRERAMNVGMDDFLAKPVSPARLLGSLARFC